MAHAGGRPTLYNEKLANKIYIAISTSSKGITRLCKEDKSLPDQDTVYKWIADKPEFLEIYLKAKRNQMNYLCEQMLDIADDTEHDYKKNREGNIVANNELVNRSRLKIDTRKWLMAKLMPKVYGDKIGTFDDNRTRHEDALKELE